MNTCGCEVGDDCTKTTVCAVQNAVEDAEEVARDALEQAQKRIHELEDALRDLQQDATLTLRYFELEPS